VLAFLEAKLIRGRWWMVAVIAFGLYYLGSAIAAWFAGTLYSRNMLIPTGGLFDFSAVLRVLAIVKPPRSGNFVPLLSDFLHLNFSVLMCLFGFPLGYIFVRKIPREFREYFESGTREISAADASEFIDKFYSRVGSPWNIGGALVFALFAASTFVLLARSRSTEAVRWWGNSQFGNAGYYLAFGQTICCYYAFWGFELFLILNQFIRKASLKTKTLHTFHQDGYYGFQPLARLVEWQATLLLLAGLALFSTFYIGYFGLEKRLLVLACMFAFTIGTGIALALPLVVLTRHVRELRAKAIAELEPRIHDITILIGQGKIARKDRESRDELEAMMNLHDKIKATRTAPFGLASLNGVIVGYSLQALVLIQEFYSRYK
jgi:hypothetical protein